MPQPPDSLGAAAATAATSNPSLYNAPIPRAPLTPIPDYTQRRRSRSDSNYPATLQPTSRIHWTDDDAGAAASGIAPLPPLLSRKQTTEKLLKKIEIENNIKKAAEAMLQAYATGKKNDPLSKRQVELQVNDSIRTIANLRWQVDYIEGLSSKEKQRLYAEVPSPQTIAHSPVISEPEINLEDFDYSGFIPTFDQQFSDISDQGLLVVLDSLLKTVLRKQNLPFLQRVDVIRRITKCLAHPSWRIRAQGYRLLRHVDMNWDEVTSGVEYFEFSVLRSLAHEDCVQSEREQALKFTRLMFVKSQAFRREGFVRMLIALAEHTDDKLRNMCLLTLCELLIRNPELAIRAGAIKVLTAAACDGPWEMSRSISEALVFSLNRPSSRRFITLGVDLEVLVAGINDSLSRSTVHEDRARIAGGILAIFFNSWPGLHYLMSNDQRAFISLVHSLRDTPKPIQLIILRMLYLLLGVPRERHLESGDRGDLGADPPQFGIKRPIRPNPTHSVFRLTSLHRTIVLMFFIDAGLLNSLVAVAVGKDADVSRVALRLMFYLLQTTQIPLPRAYVDRLQRVPFIFKKALDFDHGATRHEAADLFQALENYGAPCHTPIDDPLRAPTQPSSRLRQRLLSQMRQRLTYQFDQVEAQSLINESRVLGSSSSNHAATNTGGESPSDPLAWNWDVIDELLTGPFTNTQSLDDALTNTAFFSTLLHFYDPNQGTFRQLPRTKPNLRYVQTGCTMLSTLLATSEGAKWLRSQGFLPTVRNHLEALTPMSAVDMGSPEDSIFARNQLRSTLSCGYLKLLQILGQTPRGNRLLEHFGFYHLFYFLAQMRSQDEVIKGILTHMDYQAHGHPRVILAQIMTTANKLLRLFATRYLGQVLAYTVPDFHTWGIELLLRQVYDPALDVQKLALALLLDLCDDVRNLESLIAHRPNFAHLGESWMQLQLKFVGVPTGFDYLQSMTVPTAPLSAVRDDDLSHARHPTPQAGLVTRMAEHWFHHDNKTYASRLETEHFQFLTGNELFLSESDYEYEHRTPFSMGVDTGLFELEPPPDDPHGFAVPLHFFGQLIKTVAGRQLIEEQNYLDKFVEKLVGSSMDFQEAQELLDFKAVLWALAHMGADEAGAVLLESRNVIDAVISIFNKTQICTLKGTCLYALGMMAMSSVGANTLLDYGWMPVRMTHARSKVYFVPPNLVTALRVDHWRPIQTLPPARSVPSNTEPPDSPERTIMQSIGSLCNNILQNAACKALVVARERHKDLFKSMAFCRKVLDFIGHNHFRLNARRFIIDLFSIDLAAHLPTFNPTVTTTPKAPSGSAATHPPIASPKMTLKLRKAKPLPLWTRPTLSSAGSSDGTVSPGGGGSAMSIASSRSTRRSSLSREIWNASSSRPRSSSASNSDLEGHKGGGTGSGRGVQGSGGMPRTAIMNRHRGISSGGQPLRLEQSDALAVAAASASPRQTFTRRRLDSGPSVLGGGSSGLYQLPFQHTAEIHRPDPLIEEEPPSPDHQRTHYYHHHQHQHPVHHSEPNLLATVGIKPAASKGNGADVNAPLVAGDQHEQALVGDAPPSPLTPADSTHPHSPKERDEH